jgi:predicted HTH transcriptional regulator
MLADRNKYVAGKNKTMQKLEEQKERQNVFKKQMDNMNEAEKWQLYQDFKKRYPDATPSDLKAFWDKGVVPGTMQANFEKLQQEVYKGDVFMLVNQAVDFVLSRINVSTGTRDNSNQVDVEYEIPRAVVSEAIVNAIVHRDYTSNGSVQIMLFKDRLEIWNPGTLPLNLTVEDLKKPHSSYPNNLLLAEPMYLAGYIERIGTGTMDMLVKCKEKGLREIEFIQDDVFKTIIWRNGDFAGQFSGELTGELTGEVTGEVKRVVSVLTKPMKRSEIQKILQLRHDDYFRLNYIIPALKARFIELLYPDSPNHPQQKYKLTDKGKSLQIFLRKENNEG